MKIISEYALNLADATQTTQTSNIIETESCTTFSMQAIAAGSTITGTVQLQVSNDPVPQANQVTNWSSPTGSYQIAISAASTPGAVSSSTIPDFCWRWARVVYTKATSAAGALITVSVKSDGF